MGGCWGSGSDERQMSSFWVIVQMVKGLFQINNYMPEFFKLEWSMFICIFSKSWYFLGDFTFQL